jgi:hypothetical protein
LVTLLREFNVEILAERRIIRRSGGGAEGSKIEAELKTYVPDIRGTTLVDNSVLHRQENVRIGGERRIIQCGSGGVMEGEEGEIVGVEPVRTKELFEVDFMAIDDGAGVLVEAESVEEEFGAEIGVVEGRNIDVMGVGALSS